MTAPDTLRYAKIPLNHGSGGIPALGFGTLIPDPLATEQATKTALEVGFRHFDCSERYRNEQTVGDAMQEVFKAGTIQRKEVFVTTKLWNNTFTWLARNRPKTLVITEDIEALAPADGATPEEALIAKAGAAAIELAIGALPPPFKETLVLRDINGLSYRDIAEITGAPLGTVMSRLARARGFLIAALGRPEAK